MPFFGRTGEPGTITLADRARAGGDWEGAARHYRAALVRNPDKPPIWVQYGHALKESGRLIEAEAAYRRALDAEPGVADTHVQLGHVRKLMGRPAEARAAYLDALALDPDWAPARHELAEGGWNAAELASVRQKLTAAMGRQRRRRSPIALADLARDLGQWEIAARLYQKALDRNPRRPEIWVQYGHALKQSGRLAEAEAAYRQALAGGGCDADVLLQLGHVLKLQGKTEEAQAAYLRAFVADPGMPDAKAELNAAGWAEPVLAELQSQAARTSTTDAAIFIETPAVRRDTATHPVSPTFSVIMPVYDRTWELREALDSVLSQSFADFELIIVTDASPPATMAIVSEYLAKDQRIRGFFYDDNSGNACRGRNRGIIEAHGEFISLIDSDDQFFPDTLEKAHRILREQDVDFLCGRAYFIVDGTRKVGDFVTGSTNTVGPINLDRLLRENPIQTCTVHVRRDLLIKRGGFRVEQRYLEDLELWARLAHHGCRFYFTDELLAKYRFHQGNHELTYIEQTAYWFEHLRNNYLRPFDDWGVGPAGDRSGLDAGRNPHDVPVWPGRVDPRWYLSQYPDVARAEIDPLVHFTAHGRHEGRKPNAEEARADGWVSVTDVEITCLKAPSSGDEIVLFVTHSPHGRLKPHVRHYLQSLTRQGIAVIVIVAADAPFTADPAVLQMVDGFFVRNNEGYDFAAWAHVIRLHPEVCRAKILYLANDSVFGPVNDGVFGSLISRIRASDADFIGLTESFEQGWHFQSYFIAIKSRGLNSSAFNGFIEAVRGYLDKQRVIDEYELRFAATMRIGGLRCEAMFPQTGFANPTLFQWKALVASGFPFLKVVTVRDTFPDLDVSDWRQVLRDRGYDVSLAEHTLAELLAAKGATRDDASPISVPPARREHVETAHHRATRRAIIFSHDLSSSGAPKIVYDMARALLDDEWSVTVMSSEDGATRHRLMAIGVDVLINPLAPSIHHPDRPTHESVVTLASTFDVVVLNTIVCWPLAVALRGSAGVFWYVHESGLVRTFAKAYGGFAGSFHGVTGVWTGSLRSAAALREIGVETIVVEYGIDEWPETPTHGPEAAIIISLLASCEPRKGQDLAVSGFRALPEAMKDRCRLQLAGRVLQPEFERSVRDLADGEPKIAFQGELSVEGYAAVLQQSDIILCPSRDDTLPLVSLDALAAGKILICSGEVGTSDYLADGVSGFVIPHNTPQGIATALATAVDRRREWPAMRAAARRLVAERFSHQRFARRLHDLIASADVDRLRAAS